MNAYLTYKSVFVKTHRYMYKHVQSQLNVSSLSVLILILLLTSCLLCFCRLLIFIKINFFEKNLSGIPSDSQTDWIQIRSDILSGLIWVQTVWKSYRQTTLVCKELKKRSKCFVTKCSIIITSDDT